MALDFVGTGFVEHLGKAGGVRPRDVKAERPLPPTRWRIGRRHRLPRACGPEIPECLGELAENEVVHIAGVAKSHLVLGRMDVDVDFGGRALEEQHEHRVATVKQHVTIRLANRVAGEPIAHGPAVDVEALARRASIRVRRQPDPAP